MLGISGRNEKRLRTASKLNDGHHSRDTSKGGFYGLIVRMVPKRFNVTQNQNLCECHAIEHVHCTFRGITLTERLNQPGFVILRTPEQLIPMRLGLVASRSS